MIATYISIEKNFDVFERYKEMWGNRGINGIRVDTMTAGIETAITIEKSKIEYLFFVDIVADDIDFMPLLSLLDETVDAPILIAVSKSKYTEDAHHAALNNGAYFYRPYCDDPQKNINGVIAAINSYHRAAKKQKSPPDLDPTDTETVRYACADSDYTLRLYHIFNEWFDRYLPGHRRIVEAVESPTAVYCGLMKYNGLPVDRDIMLQKQTEAVSALADLRERIAFMIGDVDIGVNASSNDSRASGSIYGEITFPIGFTDPVRGTVTATPSVFETATISWSGFAHGTSNNIASYDIAYQQSTDNANWGSAVTLANVVSSALSGSYSWSSGTRGYYYRFNVIAKGTQSGTQSASGVWTAGIRKNRLPNAPGNPGYASPASDSNGTQSSTKLYIPESAAAFAWDAATDPDGGAVTYEIQPLARDAANSAWVNDGALVSASGNSYSFPITAKPRGITNGLALASTPDVVRGFVRRLITSRLPLLRLSAV